MKGLRCADDDNVVLMPNERAEQVSKIGSIDGTIYDKHGYERSKVTMEEVSYVPNFGFNVFSLTKMMKKGWALSGNKDTGITISKDGGEVHFDIPIETQGGQLWAMCMDRIDTAGVVQLALP